MRTPVIAGNWKMNLDRASSTALARAIRDAADRLTGVEIGLAPPFPYLTAVAEVVAGSSIWVAGQDMHWEASGAFTGDVSGPMLRDAGCSHVILGHSERRHGWKETAEQVGKKVVSALEVGLIPIVCVGETLAEREAGQTEQIVIGQLDAALAGQTEDSLDELIVAYEPVWAIGTGVNATSQQAGEVHQILRKWMADRFSTSFAESVRIQYGGSVKPSNAAELLAVDGVDGALVGGASLKPEDFGGISSAAAQG